MSPSRYWLQLADPDGSERAAGDQHGRRRMHVSHSLGGWCYGEFGLDPIRGAIVDDTIGAVYDELFRTDSPKPVSGSDGNPPSPNWPAPPNNAAPTPSWRRRPEPASPPPTARRPAPLFTILVGYETFAGRVCELANGTVITPGALVPYLHDARIERVVFDGPSRIIDVGEARLFTGALRRAIQVRDRFCYHDYCDVPAHRCQIDHIIRYPTAAAPPKPTAASPANTTTSSASDKPSRPTTATRRAHQVPGPPR